MKIIPARLDHIAPFLVAMADDDLAELIRLAAGMEKSAAGVLQEAIRASTHTFCGLEDEMPIVLGGAVFIGSGAIVWMVSAREAVRRDMRGFLTASRAQVDFMLQKFVHLQTSVDHRWISSVRWLRWLGWREYRQPFTRPDGRLVHLLEIGQ